MQSEIVVSVVIGYKDWGLERLQVCIQELQHSFGEIAGEVIVSDYGSTNRRAETVSLSAGARYVYTPTDGVWSRSRALNAGIAEARGQVLVTTDADMLFSPRSMAIVGKHILEDPHLAIVLQCRDLLPGWSADKFAEGVSNWNQLPEISRFRPRWGMGGMFAVHRNVYTNVRGFDERMQVYGGEDLDFANRVRRAGVRLEWIDHPEVRMYHMWHPSSRTAADETPQGREAVRKNREIYLNDSSTHRNIVRWRHSASPRTPLVSVVICTYNRAELLRESIQSVQWQSFQEFEILIVDDGSTDHTESVVTNLQSMDPRIKYFKREKSGIAASRNFGNAQATGKYIAIHDSDDLMAPRRLEWQLKSITGGVVGSYGGWADFSDNNGDLTFHSGREVSSAALLYVGRVVVHASLLLRADLARSVPYDETFTSGSDYNWVSRVLRTGARIVHTRHLHILRRLHGDQVTTTDPANQKSAAHQTSFAVRQGLHGNVDKELRAKFAALPELPVYEYRNDPGLVARMLPDHLVGVRPILVDYESGEIPLVEDLEVVGEYRFESGRGTVLIAHASLAQLAALATAGVKWDLVGGHETPLRRFAEIAKGLTQPVLALESQGSDSGFQVQVAWAGKDAEGDRLAMGLPSESGYEYLVNQFAKLPPGKEVYALMILPEGEAGLNAVKDFLEGVVA